jgi:hypothetical protein
MNYTISEETLTHLKTAIEAGANEILEPSSGKIKIEVLRLMELGMGLIDMIKSTPQNKATQYGFGGADEDCDPDKQYSVPDEWSDQESDVHRELEHHN